MRKKGGKEGRKAGRNVKEREEGKKAGMYKKGRKK